jgi:Ni/Fe-hydrogenase subunit HybB-like protein
MEIITNVINTINRQPRFYIWISALVGLMVLGAFGFLMSLLVSMQLLEFHHAIPWTMQISTYIFFVASSTGICMVTSLGHLFGVKRFELIGKRGAFLALITVTFGMTAIILHLGHPERSFYFYLTPNIRSAIWGMSFFYTFAIPFIMAELWFLMRADFAKKANNSIGYKQLIYRLAVLGQRDKSHAAIERDHKRSSIAAGGALVFELAAFSTLGSIFGHTQAKAFWHGTYFPLFFLLSALFSGLAWLIAVTTATYKLQKKEIPHDLKKLIFEMSNMFAVALSVGLLFIAYKTSSGLLDTEDAKTTMLLLRGPFSIPFWLFEITVGTVIPALLILYSLKKEWIGGLLAASVMTLVGAFLVRYDFLIAGQVYPYFDYVQMPKMYPTVIESFVVAGIFGGFFMVYTLAVKFLPLEEERH